MGQQGYGDVRWVVINNPTIGAVFGWMTTGLGRGYDG